MTIFLKFLRSFFILTFIIFIAIPAHAQYDDEDEENLYYRYANNHAEYSVDLPSAPTVLTIWGDSEYHPYVDPPALQSDALGEAAYLKFKGPKDHDIFDLEILFLNVDEDFLQKLTKEKIEKDIKENLTTPYLQAAKFEMSENPKNKIKWAVFTGFQTTAKNKKNPYYHSINYLTGKKSITVISVKYSLKNQRFAEYYKTMIESIKFYNE